MCGIAGCFARRPVEPAAVFLVDRIVKSQLHRGPDYQAVEVIRRRDPLLVFGHDRLSIIDLSDKANQPMWDHEHRLCLVFNGEIYNYRELSAELRANGHRFLTQSDSEVILEAFKAWGTEAISRFNGMFAFALADTLVGKMWLVRDRFGVKPLYYHQSGDDLVFASTGRVIAEHFNLPPNLRYVGLGLTTWLYEDDGDLAPYEGLRSLPSSHYLEVEMATSGSLKTRLVRYYDFAKRVTARREEIAGRDEGSLTEEIASHLQRAVAYRLRADVPVAVSLSGGLDSSTVTALAVAQQQELIGFSFGHPSDAKSEGPIVDQLARRLGFKVVYVNPPVSRIIDALDPTLAGQDAPFPGAGIIAQYLVYQAARAEGIKVLLGGQGADEVFMGYRKFHFFLIQKKMRERRFWALAGLLLNSLRMMASEISRLRDYTQAARRYFRPRTYEGLLNLPETALNLRCSADESLAMRQVADVMRLSLPTLLRYEDRNSMAHGIESRLPFLDFQLAELAVALPDGLKLRHGYGKWIMRSIMRDRIPQAIWRPRFKRGFDVPQNKWIDEGLGAAMRDRLRACWERVRPWLRRDVDLDVVFSDSEFKSRPTAFGEAVSLLWLAGSSSWAVRHCLASRSSSADRKAVGTSEPAREERPE